MNEQAKELQLTAPKSSAVTPLDMLNSAVERGMDAETLGKFMALHERWEAAQARKAFDEAMAQFKENPPRIVKNKTVSYGSGQNSTSYQHVTLDHAAEAIAKAMSPHGLHFRWNTAQDGDVITVTCILSHVQGHSVQLSLSGPADTSGSKNKIQAVGSTVTYLERYTLFAITGLAAEGQDDDGGPPELEFVTASQLSALRKLLKETNTVEADFCKTLEVETLEQLPKAQVKLANISLVAKKQVQEAQAKKAE